MPTLPPLTNANANAMINLDQMNILIVDDNQPMRRLFHTLIGLLGPGAIHEAHCGESALKILRDHPIDIMISDWRMNPMDGESLVRYIRTSPDSPNPFLPIIAVSAYATEDVTPAMYDLGVNAVMVKPITMSLFLNTVRAVVARPLGQVRSFSFA